MSTVATNFSTGMYVCLSVTLLHFAIAKVSDMGSSPSWEMGDLGVGT